MIKYFKDFRNSLGMKYYKNYNLFLIRCFIVLGFVVGDYFSRFFLNPVGDFLCEC